ncbi:unnamed protein product [Prorocentrum cordatum]|uniref:Inositol polyphosphate-related phosphatase domain-containing protein n=1 Tax=Prorocentrum cordatum TaxID=2364126 RepID=A0ABN9VI45_9DINO|nr:unnamed protein product [Polarella glacialis]
MGAGGKLNVNKGAACASLRMPGLGRMGFVGAHFTAGQSSESASEARCQDFHHVLSTLRPTGAPADGGAGTGVPDNFAQVEVLFFTGDLNSRLRVRSDAEAIVEAFKRVDTARHADLLRQDELHYWRNNGLAFDPRDGWEEANIGFPPSYKLIADSAGHSSLEGEAYVYERSALPAWCDRVLWRARGHCVEAREYSSREADLEALGGRQRWSLRRRGDGCRGPVARGKDRGPARGRGRNLRAPHRPRAPRRPAALPAVAQRPGQRPAVEAAGAARHARGVLRLGQGLVPRGARLARGPAARRGAVRGQVPHARRGVVAPGPPRESVPRARAGRRGTGVRVLWRSHERGSKGGGADQRRVPFPVGRRGLPPPKGAAPAASWGGHSSRSLDSTTARHIPWIADPCLRAPDVCPRRAVTGVDFR